MCPESDHAAAPPWKMLDPWGTIRRVGELGRREWPVEIGGALVGWNHVDLGDKVLLVVQSLREGGPRDKPDEWRLLLTKSQAAVLGNYLGQASGMPMPAPRERSWFRRLFG